MRVGVEDSQRVLRAARPPSRGNTAPLRYDERSDARNSAASHTSSAVPHRLIGDDAAIFARTASGSGARSVSFLNRPTSVADGANTLTRTPSGACSIAACLHKFVSAPLAAQYAAWPGEVSKPSVEPIAMTEPPPASFIF